MILAVFWIQLRPIPITYKVFEAAMETCFQTQILAKQQGYFRPYFTIAIIRRPARRCRNEW
jgi:hypothetical protein